MEKQKKREKDLTLENNAASMLACWHSQCLCCDRKNLFLMGDLNMGILKKKKVMFRVTEELWKEIAKTSVDMLLTHQTLMTNAVEEYLKKLKRKPD